MLSKLSPWTCCLGISAALTLKERLEGSVRKAIFILKDRRGDGMRDWVEGYRLTPPRQSFYLVSQGCCRRDDPAVIEAGSRPSLQLQGHMWTLLFSVRRTAVNGENTMLSPTQTHTNTLYICFPLVAMPLSPTRPSRTPLELFRAFHKWSTSLTVTKQQSPGKASDFQTPQLCTAGNLQS